jgi:hypothetical protein
VPKIPCFNPASYPRSYSPPGGAAFGDIEVFAAIAARLAATGEFAAVMLGSPDDAKDLGADGLPAALIGPLALVEDADAESEAGAIRHVTYLLCLAARRSDPAERYCALARSAAAAQNALDGNDLGGRAIASLSRLRKGRIELSSPGPLGRVLLTGEFSYAVPDVTARVP